MEHGFTWLSGFGWREPIATAVLVSVALVAFAALLRRRTLAVVDAINPENGMTIRNVGEIAVEGLSGLAEGVLGHGHERYVPLLATLFVYILVSNLLGLVPGFSPPSGHFQMTFGLGIVTFLAYNAYGMKEHGVWKYLQHFLGPVLFIAPLMLIIELFSHSFRPISLGIRLFANMDADHKVIALFTDLTHFGIPVAFYILGTFVSVVQAFVFTILTAIYISLAVAHDH